MKKLILNMLLFITFSCNKSEERYSFTPQTISPVLIGKGFDSGNITQQNTVIQNETQWNQLLNLFSSNAISTFTTTIIDFNNYELIVAIDEVKGDTGYSIDISNVVENATNITATITSVNGGNGFTVLSQPFHIIKIPKSTKPVVFQ